MGKVLAAIVMAAWMWTPAQAQPGPRTPAKPVIDSGAVVRGDTEAWFTYAAGATPFEEVEGRLVVRAGKLPDAWRRLGLRNGDVIAAVNGQGVTAERELRSALTMAQYGQVIYVEVDRGKKKVLLRRVIEGATSTSPIVGAGATEAIEAAVTMAAKLDAGIRRVDDTTVEFDRGLADELIADPLPLTKGARVMPSTKDGVSNGFRLYAIRPGSVFARLGFANGDTVTHINGLDVSTADRALAAYDQVRNAKAVTLAVIRRGKPITLTIRVR